MINRRQKVSRKQRKHLPSRGAVLASVSEEIDSIQVRSSGSPRWNNTAKIVAGLSLLAVSAWLLLRFREVVGVLVVAVLLAYLLYPLSGRLRAWTRVSWRVAATVVFVFTLLLVIGLVTLGGLAIVDQAQSLVGFLTVAVTDLPVKISGLQPIEFAGFKFTPPDLTNVNQVSEQFSNVIEPMLTRTTSLLTSIASGAASTVGWFFFAMLVAYFILAESGGIPGRMISLRFPGYTEDMSKFGRYLNGIWNAFLRGQLTIIFITVVVYIILLSILGVHFVIGLAILAGLARFVPYVGPAVAWTSFGLVAFFQRDIPFGLSPIGYVLLVVGLAWLTDVIMDNFVSARLMGNALKIHPAVVMVSAIIAANLLGLIGVMLAAPVVATLKLLLQYVINKLLDRDPWEGVRTTPPPLDRSIRKAIQLKLVRIKHWLESVFQRMNNQTGS